MTKQLSIIIPVYNEEKVIEQTIKKLCEELIKIPDLEYEIITVNDASTDKSKEILKTISGIKVINHITNKGYGASLKTGIEEAKFNTLLFFDADGQHKPEHISELLKYSDDFDLVSGARVGYRGPIIRQPGKKILQWLTNYLSGQKIPDINCGLRIVKKDKISMLLHLLCNTYSFSTTTLLVFATGGFSIKYVPITINKREEGKSGVKPKHAVQAFMLILRMILLTSPLRIFLPISFFLFILTVAFLIQNLIHLNISDVTILLFVSTILIFFFGLLADQVAAIRKEVNLKK